MRWRLIIAAALACAAAAAIALWVLDAPLFGHWLQVHTGTVNESGPYYGFWSGFGSDLEEFGILGAIGAGIYQLVKKYNCHEPGCWRIGQHPAAGGQFLLCYRHHPDYHGRKPTHELIERLHREHLERQAAELHEVHQHLAAKPATANDAHRPQPSARRLGPVPISRSETARWRSRISSSSALALFAFAAIRLHGISARSSRACIRAVCTGHATSASRLAGSHRDSMSMSWAAASPGRDVSRHAP
jgi:hypothetical protein